VNQPVIMFNATSGNVAAATLEFGPNSACAVRIRWTNRQTEADEMEFERALPVALALLGLEVDDTRVPVERHNCASAEQMNDEIRKFFAAQNTN